MKHLQDIIKEGLLDVEGNDEKMDHVIMREAVEKETGWTLSSDGRYILSGTKYFLPSIAFAETVGSKYNRDWFERLINCAKKYKIKIQPIDQIIIMKYDIPLLENVDIVYLNELKILCDDADTTDIDLSKIKIPIQRVYIKTSGRIVSAPGNIVLPKHGIKTVRVGLSNKLIHTREYKNLKCENMIIEDELSGLWNINWKDPKHMQYIVDNNPNVSNFFIIQGGAMNSYYQAKLKSGQVINMVSKSAKALTSKGVLKDEQLENNEYKHWYEKHM